MIKQVEFSLGPFPRGVHLITRQVISNLYEMPEKGLLHLMLKHTSAGLTINENADPTVREDMNVFLNNLVPDMFSDFKHIFEGPDDMSAHVKASIIGTSVSIPITDSVLNLGIWQGIYLCEFRNNASKRKFVATIIG
ncbi:MAG: secondary thiamine-phosphate synthase enzyme YjbQ [Marinilabiliales bacterium]